MTKNSWDTYRWDAKKNGDILDFDFTKNQPKYRTRNRNFRLVGQACAIFLLLTIIPWALSYEIRFIILAALAQRGIPIEILLILLLPWGVGAWWIGWLLTDVFLYSFLEPVLDWFGGRRLKKSTIRRQNPKVRILPAAQAQSKQYSAKVYEKMPDSYWYSQVKPRLGHYIEVYCQSNDTRYSGIIREVNESGLSIEPREIVHSGVVDTTPSGAQTRWVWFSDISRVT